MAVWCAIADPRYTLTCQNSSRSVYSVALWHRKKQFLPVFGLRYLVVSTVGGRLRKLSTGAHATTNLPLSNGIKLVSVLQRLLGEIVRTKSDVHKRDEQINKQKTQRFWPPRRRVKSEPHQTWHGDRGPQARPCTSKTFFWGGGV